MEDDLEVVSRHPLLNFVPGFVAQNHTSVCLQLLSVLLQGCKRFVTCCPSLPLYYAKASDAGRSLGHKKLQQEQQRQSFWTPPCPCPHKAHVMLIRPKTTIQHTHKCTPRLLCNAMQYAIVPTLINLFNSSTHLQCLTQNAAYACKSVAWLNGSRYLSEQQTH